MTRREESQGWRNAAAGEEEMVATTKCGVCLDDFVTDLVSNGADWESFSQKMNSIQRNRHSTHNTPSNTKQ